MKVNKTNNYEMFKFRSDNRDGGVNRSHVDKIKRSISAKNMLDLVPITVNEDMEIMDGQHRLVAAKELGVDIYYQVEKNLEAKDIILMNINKAWAISDFFNFHVKNHHPEYLKLKKFIDENQVGLRVALRMLIGTQHEKLYDFKTGNYVHSIEGIEQQWDAIWQTIGYIRKMNGNGAYLTSSRFWMSLYALVNNPNFDMKKWMENLAKMVDKVRPMVSTKDYKYLFMRIYNWNNRNKIELLEEESREF